MKNLNGIITLLLLVSCFSNVQAQLPYSFSFGESSCANNGISYTDTDEVSGTVYDNIYEDECYFQSTTSCFISQPLTPGNDYTVYLHFAEIYYGVGNIKPDGGDGTRIFHVDIEDTRVINSLDIHAVAGPSNALVYKYDFTEDGDGLLKLTLTPVLQNAKISAIEIVESGNASMFPPEGSIIDLNNPSFPVEWIDFDVAEANNRATISWSTAWESNNAGFEIQVAELGQKFETLDFVSGAGDATEPMFYSYETNVLNEGLYLFRLKQVDFDGSVSLSPMVELTIGNPSDISIQPLSPNPAEEFTTVRFFAQRGEEVNISLFNMFGQTVTDVFAGEIARDGQQTFTVNTSTLPVGYYFIKTSYGNEVYTQKLLVSPR